MKRFLFAVAQAALFASVGSAEEKVAPAPTAAAPVVITPGAPVVVESSQAQSTRRGLFGRLRNRSNSTSTYSPAPVMTAPVNATQQPPISAPAPMPMPGTKTNAQVMPQPGTIVQASGNVPAGTYTTTDGTIVQIGGTQMATEPMSSSSQSTRRGLFGRLRSR